MGGDIEGLRLLTLLSTSLGKDMKPPSPPPPPKKGKSPSPTEKLAHTGNYLLRRFDVSDYKTYKKSPVGPKMKRMGRALRAGQKP